MHRSFHRAGWVMVTPTQWIENGVVELCGGRIAAVGRGTCGTDVQDHGAGIIMPALVNGHAHLSLSALAGRVNTGFGFVDWVKDLIRVRTELSQQQITAAAVSAAESAKHTGTGLIAEVGPMEPGAGAMERAGLQGIVFNEVLGNHKDPMSLPDDRNGMSFTHAGHGLHTTSPVTLQWLKAETVRRNARFSLHLAESEAETEFLDGVHRAWSDLLTSRGIDFSDWDIRGERPVARARRLGLLGPGTLAVHVLDVTRAELAVLAESGTSICLCPRSNFTLHGRLPHFHAFADAGLEPCLGTDSAASVTSLNLFDEMAFVAERHPEIRPQTILAMGTMNGARALGRPEIGSLEPGKAARLIYVDLEARSAEAAAHALVWDSANRVEWI